MINCKEVKWSISGYKYFNLDEGLAAHGQI